LFIAGCFGGDAAGQTQRSDLLFIALMAGTNSAGSVVAGGVEAQTSQALQNVTEKLKAGGMDFKDLVWVNVFLSDIRNLDGMNAAYRAFIKQHRPARTTLEADLLLPEALVGISAIAVRPALPRKIVSPAGWRGESLPYSHGIVAGDYIFLSGLAPRDPKTGSVVPTDVKTQTAQILDNAKALVGAAGFEMSDLTLSRVWLADSRDFAAMNDAYRTYFTDVPPTRATLRARLSSSAHRVEMMLWGVRGDKRRLGAVSQVPLSQAMRVGKHLFVSGIIPGSDAPRGDVKGQTKRVLQTIGNLLQQEGLDFSDVVSVETFVSDVRQAGQVMEVCRESLKTLPAQSTLGLNVIAADGLVEIAMVAEKNP
jgi:enamine deaminase RidA (YjgF/YER057c/UK114 family)